MRILLVADLHANIFALENILSENKNNYDLFVHLGDSIGIGPFPVETTECLQQIKNSILIMGNHEEYLLKGVSEINHEDMSDAEKMHHQWIQEMISMKLKNSILCYPYSKTIDYYNNKINFIHSLYKNNKFSFIPYDHIELEKYFNTIAADLVCFGHSHKMLEFKVENKILINPGCSGCSKSEFGTYGYLDFDGNQIRFTEKKVNILKDKIINELHSRKVPARDEIIKYFY